MVVTQDFLTEFELSLIRCYNKAAKKGTPTLGANVVSAATTRNDFSKEFMATFNAQREVLEREIRKGGHGDYDKVFNNIVREVEGKVQSATLRNQIERVAFEKVIRDLKVNIRSAFYDGYLGK
ncbi:hypothetical protein J4444_04140 [Candidatus Woesearchaeota archaeon]|nr:hypothetical protein [Candidatus Woesearchaeota archaeon]